jgi:protein tyrosine phosphatase (PTP) superfamily phosphohydrolase (DUF442 family)
MRWPVAVIVVLVTLIGRCALLGAFSGVESVQWDTGPDPQTLCGVPGFAWTDHGVIARAAQPSAASLACLHDAGFAAVVNLRQDSPGFDERDVVEGLGMSYLHLPIADDTAPSPAQVSAYLAFVDAQRRAGAPVLSHCSGGRGRVGVMEGIYLLWKGWTTVEVLSRYVRSGAKIDCDNGGNGQIQALHEIGLLLARGDAWPAEADQYGNRWEHCPRPGYMDGWDYGEVVFPLGQATPSPAVISCGRR